MKDDSKCKKQILCEFQRVKEYPDAMVEICKNCGKRVVYNKRDGQIDNDKYLRDHLRMTLQPWGRTRDLFIKIYGNKPIQLAEQMIERNRNKFKQKIEMEGVREKREWFWRNHPGGAPRLKKRIGLQNDT